MHVVSVNLGRPETMELGARTVTTGIRKSGVGRAWVGTFGVRGDTVADTEAHGGRDQAVYVYSAEDYSWWEDELGRELPPGTFGDNVTLSGFGEEPLAIGDRFRVGAALIEVTAPRIPCSVFAKRMEEPQWVKRFRDAERPGFYARVLEEGEVAAGDAVERRPGGGTAQLVDLYRLWYERDAGPDRLLAMLDAPIAERARRDLEERLERRVA